MKLKLLPIIIAFTIVLITAISCNKDEPIYSSYEKGEELLGGKLTVFNAPGLDAFGDPVPGLSPISEILFFGGNATFRQNWVIAPSSTKAADGLGPTFNARSCSACHFKDGRGNPLEIGHTGASKGFLMRLSIPGTGPHGEPNPVPNYGNQLEDNAIPGVEPEAKVSVRFETIKGTFADGTTYQLRKPIYTITDEKFGSLQNVLTSPRVGQQLIGLGLVEALSEESILANADENDANHDGISGKANYVWNHTKQKKEIGKFGWKANEPVLSQQIAGAFSGDIGLTASIFPDKNCPSPQEKCKRAPSGGAPEVSDKQFDALILYATSLAVPVRRNFKDPEVLEGKSLFREMRCNLCHIGKFTTSSDYSLNPTLRNVTFRPFSDFLLHDMGEALADNRPDFLATGREWRTQPLLGHWADKGCK